MLAREKIQEEIAGLPDDLLNEVVDFIGYLKIKRFNNSFDYLALASEEVLAKDWTMPSEDKAWSGL